MALTPTELCDREEIREVVLRWSRAVDRADWALFRRSHTEDLVADFRGIGIPLGDASELLAFLQRAQAQFASMHHVISNLTFHEVGAERASTSCAVTATILPRTGPPFRIGAWYHDELRRCGDEWRIARRRAEKVYEHREISAPAPVPDP